MHGNGLRPLSAMTLNAAFYSLPYDLLNDFAPILPLTTNPVVLFARKTMAANDLRELIAWLKANPNKASAGITTSGLRLVTAVFQKEIGTHFTLVPYRGSPPLCRTSWPVRSISGSTVLIICHWYVPAA
jgi:tripartite-type tricarboxylate transporter receptor subunit TctC